MQRSVRNCHPTTEKICPSLWSDDNFRHLVTSKWWVQIFYFVCFLPFFINYLTVKWFVTDSEWFTISSKTPGPLVSVWNTARRLNFANKVPLLPLSLPSTSFLLHLEHQQRMELQKAWGHGHWMSRYLHGWNFGQGLHCSSQPTGMFLSEDSSSCSQGT